MAHQNPIEMLIEASDDAIIGKTLDNVILSWNRGAERIYGYTAAEAVGQPITLLTPPECAGEPDEMIQCIRRGERIEHRETVRVTKEGRRIDISLIISPVRDAKGQIIGALTIGRDITEQVATQRNLAKLEENAVQRTLLLETANRVALDILASRTGVEALRHIAETARTLAHARYAALGVARPDGPGLQEFVTVGLTAEEEAMISPHPEGRGILGLLLQRSEPLRLDRLAAHPTAVGFPPNHPPMDSFLGVPIRSGDTVLGSLYLTNKEGSGSFTDADEAAVKALGAYAAVAIHNLHLLTRQRALVSGLIASQEEERRAVAYDLHDGLTQYVMASHAHLETFRRAHEQGQEERAQRELDQGLRYLKEAVVESRRLVNGLRSLALDDLGLAGALEQLINEEKTRAGWHEAPFLHNIAGKRYDKTLETAVFRVAQEALTNIRKHAEAARVRLLLLEQVERRTGQPQILLEVQDWGKGFFPDQRISNYAHIGLQGMIERVSLIGGTYTLKSAPGQGTLIKAEFPVLKPSSEVT